MCRARARHVIPRCKTACGKMEQRMLRVTLDSNCVFVLDEKGPKTAFMQQFVRQLINLHKQRKRCHTDCCVGMRRREKSRALRA
jgi:hypothetical protein